MNHKNWTDQKNWGGGIIDRHIVGQIDWTVIRLIVGCSWDCIPASKEPLLPQKHQFSTTRCSPIQQFWGEKKNPKRVCWRQLRRHGDTVQHVRSSNVTLKVVGVKRWRVLWPTGELPSVQVNREERGCCKWLGPIKGIIFRSFLKLSSG